MFVLSNDSAGLCQSSNEGCSVHALLFTLHAHYCARSLSPCSAVASSPFLLSLYQVVSLSEHHRRIDALNTEDLRALCKRLQVPGHRSPKETQSSSQSLLVLISLSVIRVTFECLSLAVQYGCAGHNRIAASMEMFAKAVEKRVTVWKNGSRITDLLNRQKNKIKFIASRVFPDRHTDFE